MEINVQDYLKEIENLYPKLIESYVDYYGEEYKDRIESVIDSITIIIKDEHGNYVGTNNERRVEELKREGKFDEHIKRTDDAKACVFAHQYPPIIMFSYLKPIDAHTIIHEINHTLHNGINLNPIISKYSRSLSSKLEIYKEGIPCKKNNGYIYEIINDYMSKDILEIFKAKTKFDNVDYSFDRLSYLFIDDLLDNNIGRLYKVKKPIIKKRLISCDGETLKAEMGDVLYDDVDSCISVFYSRINSFAAEYGIDLNNGNYDDIIPTLSLWVGLNDSINELTGAIIYGVKEITGLKYTFN